MYKYEPRLRRGIVLRVNIISIMFISLLFSGCSMKEGVPNGAKSVGTDGDAESVETGKDAGAVERRGLDECLIEGYTDLYDLSEMIPRYDDETYYYCGLRSESEIAFIYQKESSCLVRLLDINTGEIKDLVEFPTEPDEDGNAPYLDVISLDPLIFYDFATSMLYRPESMKDAVSLGDVRGDLVYLYGEIYVIDYTGVISRVKDDGKLEEKYVLPGTYDDMCFVRMSNPGKIMVSTNSYTGDNVYMDIDTKTWDDSVYTMNSSDTYMNGIDGSRQYTFADDREPFGDIVSLMDVDKEIEYRLSLDGLIEDGNIPLLSTLSLKGSRLIIEILESDEGVEKLLLWDFGDTEGEKWKKAEKKEYHLKEVSYEILSERAEEIEEKYGVKILFGQNIRKKVSDYDFEVCEKQGHISNSLDVIDETLEMYPEGFFDSLEDGFVRDTCFYLTGEMKPKDPKESISEANGLTSDEEDLMMLFFDITDMEVTSQTIVHEITHAIDRRLEYDGVMDESKWEELNPPGFNYYEGYISEKGEDYSTVDDDEYTAYYSNAYDEDYKDTYFVDTYSKTWPTEDRARLMEMLIGDISYREDMFQSEHLKEKLKLYFSFIREDLESDSWPEETVWEKKLKEYE